VNKPAPAREIDVQRLSRTCNQILILSVLSSGPHHGYQLALELEEKSGGSFRFRHGTLYPILHKLENEGLIRGEWQEEQSRRRRKSYSRTPAGDRYLEEQVAAWKSFFDRFSQVVGGINT
jgi:PadR family transcriptional regulator PadR